MGVKKTMDIFFEAMNGQLAPTKGYGSKVISTPMGPFGWNDALQTWVNTNNGMQMNNIAFQDMNAIMDYDTLEGGGDYNKVASNPYKITTLAFSPTTQGFDTLTPGDFQITPVFTITGNTSPVAFKWVVVSGSISTAVIKYKKNGGALVTWATNTSTGATTFASGDTLEMFVAAAGAAFGNSVIRLINVTDGNAICSNDLTIELQV
jgi:hypothetical protein